MTFAILVRNPVFTIRHDADVKSYTVTAVTEQVGETTRTNYQVQLNGDFDVTEYVVSDEIKAAIDEYTQTFGGLKQVMLDKIAAAQAIITANKAVVIDDGA